MKIHLPIIVISILLMPYSAHGMSALAVRTLRTNTIKLHMTNELMIAISFNNHKRVEECLRKGANINGIDENKDTPLLLATTNRCYQMVERLLELGAHPNNYDRFGNTALHYTLVDYIKGRCDGSIIKALTQNKVDFLLVGRNQKTALHIIVIEGLKVKHNESLKITRLLKYALAKGSKLDANYAYAKDDQGKTIFDYARQAPNSPISKLLQLKQTIDLQNSKAMTNN